MMLRNPRAFLGAAAAIVLSPTTTAVVRRAQQTSTARATPLTRCPLFPPAHHRAAFSTTTYYHRNHVDIVELPGAYSYIVDVPDLRAGDLTVKRVHDRLLDVIAERLDDSDCSSYLRKERPMGRMHHSFALPRDADLGSVSAVCRDGVLTVTVDKLPPPPVLVVIPRTIEVKT